MIDHDADADGKISLQEYLDVHLLEDESPHAVYRSEWGGVGGGEGGGGGREGERGEQRGSACVQRGGGENACFS